MTQCAGWNNSSACRAAAPLETPHLGDATRPLGCHDICGVAAPVHLSLHKARTRISRDSCLPAPSLISDPVRLPRVTGSHFAMDLARATS